MLLISLLLFSLTHIGLDLLSPAPFSLLPGAGVAVGGPAGTQHWSEITGELVRDRWAEAGQRESWPESLCVGGSNHVAGESARNEIQSPPQLWTRCGSSLVMISLL